MKRQLLRLLAAAFLLASLRPTVAAPSAIGELLFDFLILSPQLRSL